jgi:DUF1680 family protein
LVSGTYVKLTNNWKNGDVIELDIPMPVVLMQANPLVEETKNQVAVKRGPVVYCLESEGISKETDINTVSLDVNSNFKTKKITIKNKEVVSIAGKGLVETENWNNKLYKPINSSKTSVEVIFIPYFSWGNRLKGEMTVWMPY